MEKKFWIIRDICCSNLPLSIHSNYEEALPVFEYFKNKYKLEDRFQPPILEECTTFDIGKIKNKNGFKTEFLANTDLKVAQFNRVVGVYTEIKSKVIGTTKRDRYTIYCYEDKNKRECDLYTISCDMVLYVTIPIEVINFKEMVIKSKNVLKERGYKILYDINSPA